ncbi:ParB/RepB/Spo0J family partition protein [Acidimicrobiia bacterium EGI L10123]|uniref:ParB/RepB/Spo0J family partition protein n=1 Tax=Salinilacustrithrix flava TaxID=2957203 RepID=UPI003D7C32AD|nr:ParB/RepB/Spo0J family partition protein [Acidimicrobiia bacterium EGI L10123]
MNAQQQPGGSMNRKSGLGRGLGALIPAEYSEAASNDTMRGAFEVPVAAVRPNPNQPRSHFDEESLAGLTASIAEIGVLQPVLVREVGEGQFELIAGERRWRASKRAGLQSIPVVVRDADTDASSLEQALVENLHRADLNAMEEAAAYQQLVEDFGLTQDAVAKRVGKSRAAVSNTLRLFQLPPAIQALVAENQLTAGHARALLGTPDRAYQTALAQRIVRDGLSVREAEEAVRLRSGGTPDPAPTPEPDSPQKPTQRPRPTTDPAFLELESLLGDHLDTRVAIAGGGSGKGRLTIEFADVGDLERIYRRMVGG